MSKERQQDDKKKNLEKISGLESKALIKERLIWQHLTRKKIKKVLKSKLFKEKSD